MMSLLQAMDLQNKIASIKAKIKGTNVTLEDLCYMPTAPENPVCIISSPLQYFQNNRTRVQHPNAVGHLKYCAG